MAGKKKDLRWLGYNSSHTSFCTFGCWTSAWGATKFRKLVFLWDLRLFGSAGLVVVVVCIHNCKASISLCLFEGIGSNAVQERRCHTRPSQKPSWFSFLSCRRRCKTNDNTFSKKKLRTLNIQVGTLSLSRALTFAHTFVSFQQRLVAYTPGPSPGPSSFPSELERTRRHLISSVAEMKRLYCSDHSDC
jgi:hypothetical protein